MMTTPLRVQPMRGPLQTLNFNVGEALPTTSHRPCRCLLLPRFFPLNHLWSRHSWKPGRFSEQIKMLCLKVMWECFTEAKIPCGGSTGAKTWKTRRQVFKDACNSSTYKHGKDQAYRPSELERKTEKSMGSPGGKHCRQGVFWGNYLSVFIMLKRKSVLHIAQ